MAVYVDPMMRCLIKPGWRWPRSCHLFAADVNELHIFARKIGLRVSWFQRKRVPHYDLHDETRARALAAGAREMTRKEAVEFWREHFPRDDGAEPMCV